MEAWLLVGLKYFDDIFSQIPSKPLHAAYLEGNPGQHTSVCTRDNQA